MNESEKRKERLRAMRVEAEEADASHSATTSAARSYLSNPLTEDISAIPVNQDPCAPSRFDFYTDPMAAFSSDTKRVKVGNQIASNNFRPSYPGGSPMPRFSSPYSGGPRNPEMTTSVPQQFQSNYSQNQRMYQVQGPRQNFGPQSYPTGMARPFSMHHGNPPEAWNGAGGAANYSYSGSGLRPPGSPGFGPPGSPGFGPQGSPGFRPLETPAFRPPGSPGFGPPGVSGFRRPPSLQFRPQGSHGSNAGQGRGYGRSHSPSPRSVHGRSPSSSSGRGGGHSSSGRSGGHRSMSPGLGRGGRGWGSHGHSAEDENLGPEQFYNHSMIEDPWKFLKPVIWKGVDAPLNHMNTYIYSKPSTEKPSSTINESTSEGSKKSISKASLADFLVASLNKATSESPST